MLTGKLLLFILVVINLCCVASLRQVEAQSVTVLEPSSPNPTIATGSGVTGSLQCTKSSDESYAVCASYSFIAIKYVLQPFSFAAKGPDEGNRMVSCDLFETSSQSTSRVICAKGGSSGFKGAIFYNVSDMSKITNISITNIGSYPHTIVDTPSEVAYMSSNNWLTWLTPDIYKIINIASPSPSVGATLSSLGSGDQSPAAMLLIGEYLYVHLDMSPARLARIQLSTFTWKSTVTFNRGENSGWLDNLANDDNFIYDLAFFGILVRCTYNNNNFARFDSLNTGFFQTYSLSISPDSSFLLRTAGDSGILLINTSSFSIESRNLLKLESGSFAQAYGRPIIMSNSSKVFGFTSNNDQVFAFDIRQVPPSSLYDELFPSSSTPIITTSPGVVGSIQCTKSSDESYAVCASETRVAFKCILQPFSLVAKGPDEGLRMRSCDLYETSSQSTSRVICAKGSSGFEGAIFYNVSDMSKITNISIRPFSFEPPK